MVVTFLLFALFSRADKASSTRDEEVDAEEEEEDADDDAAAAEEGRGAEIASSDDIKEAAEKRWRVTATAFP